MKFLVEVNTPDGIDNIIYDTGVHSLKWSDGKPITPHKMYIPEVQKLKKYTIQLGFSCNYSCDYCLQAHTKLEKITDDDLTKLYSEIDKEDLASIRLEFWGGEPMLYEDAIRSIVNNYSGKVSEFLIITNGSLLTIDFIDFFMSRGGAIALSHDGQAQDKRGKDPITKNREVLRHMFLNYPERTSINSVLSEKNFKSEDRFNWFLETLDLKSVSFGGEGFIVDYKDEVLKIDNLEDEIFNDLVQGQGFINSYFSGKAQNFFRSIKNGTQIDKVTTSCGIDNPDGYKITSAKGSDLTCHNFNYKFTPETIHDRENCINCPVVHLCKGGCPAIKSGTKLFKNNCQLDFKVNITILRALIFMLTEGKAFMLSITPVNKLQNDYSVAAFTGIKQKEEEKLNG